MTIAAHRGEHRQGAGELVRKPSSAIGTHTGGELRPVVAALAALPRAIF
jgi:hypothetical protein